MRAEGVPLGGGSRREGRPEVDQTARFTDCRGSVVLHCLPNEVVEMFGLFVDGPEALQAEVFGQREAMRGREPVGVPVTWFGLHFQSSFVGLAGGLDQLETRLTQFRVSL